MDNKNEKQLKILFKEVGKNPEVKIIKNTLEEKQKLVNGLIEIVSYDDLLLVCNEEGKMLNMKPNLMFDYDYIAGDCFLVGDDFENGDFRSLNDCEIEKYTLELRKRSFQYLPLDEEER